MASEEEFLNSEVGMASEEDRAESIVTGGTGVPTTPGANGAATPLSSNEAAFDPLALTPAEAAAYAAASQPGWSPPPIPAKSRPFTEAMRRAALGVNLLHAQGRRRGMLREIGAELVKAGLLAPGTSLNGLGDKLGKGGLMLTKVGSHYVFPEGGITLSYLRSIGFDI